MKRIVVIVLLSLCVFAQADPLSIPHVAVPGEVIKSSDYNRNFAAVQAAANNITSEQIRDGTIRQEDLGPISIAGTQITNGSIPSGKFHSSALGEGLGKYQAGHPAAGALYLKVDGKDKDHAKRVGSIDLIDDGLGYFTGYSGYLRLSAGARGNGLEGGDGIPLTTRVDDVTIGLTGTDGEKALFLKNNSVTSGKIVDGTITNADISPTAEISYGRLKLTESITGEDIAPGGQFTSEHIVDGTLTTADCAAEVWNGTYINTANLVFAEHANFGFPTTPDYWTVSKTAGWPTMQCRLEDKLSGAPADQDVLAVLSVRLISAGNAWSVVQCLFTPHSYAWPTSLTSGSPQIINTHQVDSGANYIASASTIVVPAVWDGTGPGHYFWITSNVTGTIIDGYLKVTPISFLTAWPRGGTPIPTPTPTPTSTPTLTPTAAPTRTPTPV